MTITKRVDAVTPQLLMKAAGGVVLDAVEVTFTYKAIEERYTREGIDGVRSHTVLGSWNSTNNSPILRAPPVGNAPAPPPVTCTKS